MTIAANDYDVSSHFDEGAECEHAAAELGETPTCANCGRPLTDDGRDEPGYPCDVCGSPGSEPDPLATRGD